MSWAIWITGLPGMTGALVTVRPDMPAVASRCLMVERSIGHLLVTSERGDALIGIVTEADLLRAFVRSADQAAALRSP
jgi:CBS domain-containing protein